MAPSQNESRTSRSAEGALPGPVGCHHDGDDRLARSGERAHRNARAQTDTGTLIQYRLFM